MTPLHEPARRLLTAVERELWECTRTTPDSEYNALLHRLKYWLLTLLDCKPEYKPTDWKANKPCFGDYSPDI
jgi:hypothetical protein